MEHDAYRLLRWLPAGGAIVFDGCWDPRGELLAVVWRDGMLRLHDTRGEVRSESPYRMADPQLLPPAWSPDGLLIAAASVGGHLMVWDRSGRLVSEMRCPKWTIPSVAWAPDGTSIARTVASGEIELWSPRGKLLRRLQGHHTDPLDVAWHPSGRLLASSSKDSLCLWRDGKLVARCNGGQASLAWSPDGRMLAAGTVAGWLELWDEDGTFVRRAGNWLDERVLNVAWHASGGWVCGLADHRLLVWDGVAERGTEVLSKTFITAVGWHPLLPLLAAGAGFGEAHLAEPGGTVLGALPVTDAIRSQSNEDSPKVRRLVWHPGGDLLAMMCDGPHVALLGRVGDGGG